MCFVNDDPAAVWDTQVRRARKTHRCGDCPEPILPGQTYVYFSWCYDGGWDHAKMCLRCDYDRRRVFIHELLEGCRWSERFPNIGELTEALSDLGWERTPRTKVPFGFPIEDWTWEFSRHRRTPLQWPDAARHIMVTAQH